MSEIMSLLTREKIQETDREVARHLFLASLGKEGMEYSVDIGRIAMLYELAVMERLNQDDGGYSGDIFEKAFQVHRILPNPSDEVEEALHVLRTACMGVLGDRGADARQFVREHSLPETDGFTSENWGLLVFCDIIRVWLLLVRKDGWEDLTEVQNRIVGLREQQEEYEEQYLEDRDPGPAAAFGLIALYHLSKAATDLGSFLTQGSIEGDYQAIARLQAQFDRAQKAAERAKDPDIEPLCKLLEHTAYQMVRNSIWTVTRGADPMTKQLVRKLTEEADRPIFEMLPPQRAVLREQGLMSSSKRSVVVSLPTSSGKTLIAQFRILQALNQFRAERGWVAYVAPNRALVNQVCARLRRNFSDLGINVERVSPALEIDQLEESLLTNEEDSAFDVLVTTPEKLDLMLRNDWEDEIGRSLVLAVVDEAHNIGEGTRGLRLELLLATVNRECREAHFLLLTPFIDNATDVAKWLDKEDSHGYQLSMEWKPNDRAIALCRQERESDPGAYSIHLETVHTTKGTLDIGDRVEVADDRPLGLSWSKVKDHKSNLAAATTQVLKDRGPVIVIAGQKGWAWSMARKFMVEQNKIEDVHEDVSFAQRYLEEEFVEEFELIELLSYGVGVHHAGLSDGARRLVEWLLERERIKVLVATTTIAQGVNFPVAGVVMAHNKYYSREEGAKDMPPADFWNLAGRAGRIDQEQVGLVALSAPEDGDAVDLRRFIRGNVLDLNSTLIDMVEKALDDWSSDGIESLYHRPEWSSFLQYLVHSYRQINDSADHLVQIEQVLRGTLGYQTLRDENSDLADQLLREVNDYTSSLHGPLKLVDRTGFSLESVRRTLGQVTEAEISLNSWREDGLFDHGDDRLRSMMGVLLEVPELRSNLKEVVGGDRSNGSTLSDMIKDWVGGASISEMATQYYLDSEDPSPEDQTKAISKCCSRLFGKLTQTTAWGLSALQSMSIEETDEMTEAERTELRQLPSLVFYGVNNSSAMALRSLGVPRKAAMPLAESMEIEMQEHELADVRNRLNGLNQSQWDEALGPKGEDYYRAWRIFEGLDQ